MRQDDAALDPRGDPQAGSGSIRIDGQEALGRHRLLEEKIAYVPQENPLIPELTAFVITVSGSGGNGGRWSGIWNAASVMCWAWTDS